MANSLNFVFSRTVRSTPSQSAPRGSGAVSDRDNHAHAMSSPSDDYRAISTPRPPPISGHLGENTVPTFEEENDDLLFTPSPGSGGRAHRRRRAEIYGSVPTRSTSRRVVGARDQGVISMPEVPFFRLPNKNLDVSQKAQFVMAVKDGIARKVSIAETTKRYGLGKNAYHVYSKQMRERTGAPKPKSGRPQKLNKADKEVLMDINDEHRGSLTFAEMAREFSKHEKGFSISAATVYRIYRRDGWRSIRKRPCPRLTEDLTSRSSGCTATGIRRTRTSSPNCLRSRAP